MEAGRISHYRILEKLGAGGMGEVYLAEDMKLGRKVAIKILSEEYTTSKDRLHRFEQEACAASALNHPNILTIHEVGNDEGRHFIATEFIDGVTLRKKISESHLEMRTILDIAIQVAGALEEAHGAGIIHRDIKPDNIMIRRNGFAKVLDFGLAKLTEDSTDRSSLDAEAATRVLVQTDAGVVMGTSHYMSPEQARGKPVDARSDIWSLGVVIYEMIAGRTPFEGETSTDVIVAITQKEPQPLARFAPNVPSEVEWIISKALRKDRDERYQTIKELLTDLKRLRQRLEFEAELERSTAPDSVTRSAITGLPAAPTVPEKAMPTVEKTLTHASSAEYIVSGIRRHKLFAGIAASLFVVAVAAAVFFYFNRAQALTDKDTVLLADFVNTTGEPVFDGTLRQALAVQLGQTPFLNIYPEERVRETLRFMGKSPDERITRAVGREICERQGIKALLSGSITSLGTHYVITLEALNAHTGDPIASEQIEADSKEKVLASLGMAASNLRQKLGESLSSIKKYDVSIEQATTSSLEALKAYAMGNEERAKGKSRESLVYYQRAVELDPNFAMAYARIAVFYGNQEQIESAKEYVEKAFALRDRVSEREKLYISEKYYNYVTGEVDQAIQVLQAWASQYPNDYIPHNNLALNYFYLGRYQEGLKEALEAIRLSPNNVSARDNSITGFLCLNRLDEAEQATNGLASINPDSASVSFTRYILAFLHGDHATMDTVVQPFKGKPEEADMLSTLAATDLYYGKLSKAQDRVAQARDLYNSQKRNENAAQTTTSLALNQAFLGKCKEAKQSASTGLALSRGRISMANAASAAALCNDVAQTQSLIDELTKQYPKDTGIVMAVASIKAQLAANAGRAAESVPLLETLRKSEMGLMAGLGPNYLRGECYLQMKMGREAADEFQKIIDHPGIDTLSPAHVLAHLGVARAAVIAGDMGKARKEYQDFFALWKDADLDLPILVQARKEYDQLK